MQPATQTPSKCCMCLCDFTLLAASHSSQCDSAITSVAHGGGLRAPGVISLSGANTLTLTFSMNIPRTISKQTPMLFDTSLVYLHRIVLIVMDRPSPKLTNLLLRNIPIAFSIVLQQLVHHVLHSNKPAGDSLVDQGRVRPEEIRRTGFSPNDIFSLIFFLLWL